MQHFTLCALVLASAAGAQTLTQADLLRQLADLDRLSRLQPGVVAGQATSWDRRERESWGPNGDAGNYIRVEPNGEGVMAELEGPGCVFHLWSANPKGTLRFYLDGDTTPTFEWDHAELYSGRLEPFIAPLAWRRGEEVNNASNLYFAIPYAQSLKITSLDAGKPAGQYYYVNYVTYPAGWSVPSFRLPLAPDALAARDAVAQAWRTPGADPAPPAPGTRTLAGRETIAPGGRLTLADLTGAGQIRGLRLRVVEPESGWQRKLLLEGRWDGADWPQVLSPVAAFFGYDWVTPNYGSVPTGCLDGLNYAYWRMPYAASAQLSLLSHLDDPVTVEYEVEHAPAAWTDETMYFYARWRHSRRTQEFDWPILETAGQGTLVGTSLQIHHPIPGWWGEGDDKIWVDDRDQFPEWIGTGSEDYFGDAWGIRYLPGGSYGCSHFEGDQTCCYRWHLVDSVPFTDRLRLTIENYGPNGQWGWPKVYEYNTVAYWYQREVTPPFDQLHGRTYLGGTEPGPAPRKLPWRTDTMDPPTAADLLSNGLGQPAVVEFEELELRPGTTIITDRGRDLPFNYERAVDCGQVQPGDVLAEFVLDPPATDSFEPTLIIGPETTAGLGLVYGDQLVTGGRRPQPYLLPLGTLHLTGGPATMQIVATSAGRAVIDALGLRVAPRAPQSVEAELQQVLRYTSTDAPHPGTPLPGLSAGRALEWHADKVGDSFTLRLAQPAAGAYVLAARLLRGPGAGIVQAFVGGQPLGAPIDLYAPAKSLDPEPTPLGPVPPGTRDVEVRMVGQNPASPATHAGIDYFRWQPWFLHPESAPGVSARILGRHLVEYQIQNLGPDCLGGHQLWLQPAQNDGWIDLGVTVPETREYHLRARLTTSWDYANVQLSLDGEPLGAPVDTHTAEVQLAPELDLGRHQLTAGEHIIRLHAVGHNPASQGYLMGLDYLRLD